MEDGAIHVGGPPRSDPRSEEAKANSPECQGLEEKFPTREYYTVEEMEERAEAAQACIHAQIRYLRELDRKSRRN
jgi:hypothetical protein